jgi:hypothetical protein
MHGGLCPSPTLEPGPGAKWILSVLHLKKFISNKTFGSDDELKESVEKWLTFQVTDFYERDMQKLVPRYKFFSVGGDYVEK